MAITLEIPDTLHNQRLDKALATLLADENISRMRLQQLLADGAVKLNKTAAPKPSHKVAAGDTISITIPKLKESKLKAEKIPLDVVYEDKDLLVINKPAGLVVHPGAGNHDGTMVSALLAHCGKSLSGIGGVKRPGIVHRLDKETSGLMVVAKNDAAHQGLSEQFADRTLSRTYLAFCFNVPNAPRGTIETQIGRHPKSRTKMTVLKEGGREAITHFVIKKNYAGKAALVECKLATGRTHQIRVHMAHINCPLIGDATYGRARAIGLETPLKRQALHAYAISFIHPTTGKVLNFKTELPPLLKQLEKALQKL